jgi:hypothetical protein
VRAADRPAGVGSREGAAAGFGAEGAGAGAAREGTGRGGGRGTPIWVASSPWSSCSEVPGRKGAGVPVALGIAMSVGEVSTRRGAAGVGSARRGGGGAGFGAAADGIPTATRALPPCDSPSSSNCAPRCRSSCIIPTG